MSSINQISMTGIPSAVRGQDALLSSDSGGTTLRRSQALEPRVAQTAPSESTPVARESVGQSGAEKKAAGVDPDTLNEAIDAIREKLEPGRRALEFSVNKKLNEVIVRVVDPSSDQVIREIPPEEIITMRERLRDFGELRWSDVLPAGSLLSDVS